MIGIYLITNKINEKKYVGQSVDIMRRWKQHKEKVPYGKTSLYTAIRKYGIDNFSFQIIEECSKEELDNKEVEYIEKYNSYYEGYNETLGGSQHSHNVKLSDEDYDKIIYLLRNSNCSQKEIAKLFLVGEDTISEINNGKSRYNTQLSYPIRKNIQNYFCTDCGIKISRNSIRCVSCNAKLQRKVERPDRNTLLEELKISNFCAVGRKYGVSDNTIRKWCKMYGLPTKSSEYK